MRREDICLYLNPADRAKLEEIVANRNSPRKWVWRADIVLATADGLGTNGIMRRTGKSKPCVWRWQERYIDEGVPGLLRDKTRPSRIAPLSAEKKLATAPKIEVKAARDGEYDLIVVPVTGERSVAGPWAPDGWAAYVLGHAHCKVFLAAPPCVPHEVDEA